MTELEEFDISLNTELDKLQKEIEAFSKKDHNQKKMSLKKTQALIKSISTQLESYELEISNLDRAQANKYQASLKVIQARFTRLKHELEFKKGEGMNQENLFRDRVEEPTNQAEMNAQQMINLGDNTQMKGLEALANIQKMQHQADEVANTIAAELDKQISQLDNMYNTVKDTQSTLKRAQKYIRYFARSLYTDKLLMCLMGMIFLVIIILIIMSALGYDKGQFNVPDEVRTTGADVKNSTGIL